MDVGFQGLCNYEKVSKLLLELVLGILLIIQMGHVSLVRLLGWSNISSFLLCFLVGWVWPDAIYFLWFWVSHGYILVVLVGWVEPNLYLYI